MPKTAPAVKSATKRHDRTFICEKCKKSLKGDRSRHERTHLSGKERSQYEWTCSFCGFADMQKSNVIDHYCRAHTHDRPHACTWPVKDESGKTKPCGKDFGCASGLSRHKRDIHGYNYKESEDKSTRFGVLKKYEEFVIPPPSLAKRKPGAVVAKPLAQPSAHTVRVKHEPLDSRVIPSSPYHSRTPERTSPYSAYIKREPSYDSRILSYPAPEFRRSFSPSPPLYHDYSYQTHIKTEASETRIKAEAMETHIKMEAIETRIKTESFETYIKTEPVEPSLYDPQTPYIRAGSPPRSIKIEPEEPELFPDSWSARSRSYEPERPEHFHGHPYPQGTRVMYVPQQYTVYAPVLVTSSRGVPYSGHNYARNW